MFYFLGKKCNDVNQRSHPDWAPTVNLDILDENNSSCNIVQASNDGDIDIQQEEIHINEINEPEDIDMDEIYEPSDINAVQVSVQSSLPVCKFLKNM